MCVLSVRVWNLGCTGTGSLAAQANTKLWPIHSYGMLLSSLFVWKSLQWPGAVQFACFIEPFCISAEHPPVLLRGALVQVGQQCQCGQGELFLQPPVLQLLPAAFEVLIWGFLCSTPTAGIKKDVLEFSLGIGSNISPCLSELQQGRVGASGWG